MRVETQSGEVAPETDGAYFPSFQISAESLQSVPIFSHTTRYLPVTSCGVGPFILRLNVPISCAAEGARGLTSRVMNFGSPTCSAAPFHIASIAALPCAGRHVHLLALEVYRLDLILEA